MGDGSNNPPNIVSRLPVSALSAECKLKEIFFRICASDFEKNYKKKAKVFSEVIWQIFPDPYHTE